MDSNGLADPYVKLHLLPGASKVLNLLAARLFVLNTISVYQHVQPVRALERCGMLTPADPWHGLPKSGNVDPHKEDPQKKR